MYLRPKDPRAHAALILGNEMFHHGSSYVSADSYGDTLNVTLTLGEAKDIRDGKAQTYEADYTEMTRDGYALMRALGIISASDVRATRPLNAEGGGTFVQGTNFGTHRSYYETMTFSAPLEKVDIDLAQQVVAEERMARRLEKFLDISEPNIDRVAHLRRRKGMRFAEQLRKELAKRHMEHLLPAQTGGEFSMALNVADIGQVKAKEFMEAMSDAFKNLQSAALDEKEQLLQQVNGMDKAPEHMQQFLQKLGLHVKQVVRLPSSRKFEIILDSPISNRDLEALSDAFNTAINHTHRQPEGTSIAGLIFYARKAHAKGPEDKSRLVMQISKTTEDPDLQNACSVLTISPEETVEISQKLGDGNWESLKRVAGLGKAAAKEQQTGEPETQKPTPEKTQAEPQQDAQVRKPWYRRGWFGGRGG